MSPLAVAPVVALAIAAGGLMAAVIAAIGGARALGRPITGPGDLRPVLLRVRSDTGATRAAVGVRRPR